LQVPLVLHVVGAVRTNPVQLGAAHWSPAGRFSTSQPSGLQLYDLHGFVPLQSCVPPPTVQLPPLHDLGVVQVNPSQLPPSHWSELLLDEQMKLPVQTSVVQTLPSSQSLVLLQQTPVLQQNPLLQWLLEHWVSLVQLSPLSRFGWQLPPTVQYQPD